MPWMASIGACVAACDYNKDGWIDLYVTSSKIGSMNKLYRNNGDGTFTDVATQAGLADVNRNGGSIDAVWGDYDNDGWPDLYIVRWGTNSLYHNNGDGTFTDVTAKAGVGTWATAVAPSGLTTTTMVSLTFTSATISSPLICSTSKTHASCTRTLRPLAMAVPKSSIATMATAPLRTSPRRRAWVTPVGRSTWPTATTTTTANRICSSPTISARTNASATTATALSPTSATRPSAGTLTRA